VQEKVIKLAEELGQVYSKWFFEVLRHTVPRLCGSLYPPANNASPRARSRSPARAVGAKDAEFADADFCGMRVAKDSFGKIYVGTVVENIKGAVLAAPDAKDIRMWQATWRIEYDDGDVEQQNRLEIIASIKTYRHHRQADNRTVLKIGLNFAANIHDDSEHVDEEADLVPEQWILSTCTNFLDPRYNLLELLTPTTTQNRSSYLIELDVLDKAQKKILTRP
jgi:hypothetical protein